LKLGITMKALMWLAPAAMERVNVAAQAVVPEGRDIIEEVGGREVYDQMARERLKLSSPTIEAKDDIALVFEA
jgi:hypothetical protein